MTLRLADAGDFAALEGMLLEAVNWSPDREPLTLDQLRENDMLVRYVEGWPREGDAGVIADEGDGVVGAAWFRLFPRDRPGFGFIDESTPEVSAAVTSVWRGRGVGSQLLVALIEIGRERDIEALSLSVESRNRAVRLYRHLGFVVTFEKSSSYSMRLKL